MKKFLGISLAFCLALTACNNSPTESNKQNEATSTESSTSTLPPSSEKKPIEAAADEKVSSKDTLIVAFDREPATLDPLGNNVDVKRMIEGSIFDTLLEFDENMKPVPCLAESWEQVDELTWKFNLRKDVKFHNGDPLTSKDVKFSFLRVNNGTLGNEAASQFDPNGYETPDDYTFILKTLEPWAFTEAQVCSEALSIVPEKVVTEMGDDAFGRAPVGSGAYKFVSWTAGDNITVERKIENEK